MWSWYLSHLCRPSGSQWKGRGILTICMTIQKPLRVYTLHYNHPSLEFELTMDHTPNLLGNNSLIHKNVCCFTKWQRIVKILWVSSKVWYSYQPPFPAGTFLHRRCTFVLCMPVSVSRKVLRIEVTRHLAGCLYFKRLWGFPPQRHHKLSQQ